MSGIHDCTTHMQAVGIRVCSATPGGKVLFSPVLVLLCAAERSVHSRCCASCGRACAARPHIHSWRDSVVQATPRPGVLFAVRDRPFPCTERRCWHQLTVTLSHRRILILHHGNFCVWIAHRRRWPVGRPCHGRMRRDARQASLAHPAAGARPGSLGDQSSADAVVGPVPLGRPM